MLAASHELSTCRYPGSVRPDCEKIKTSEVIMLAGSRYYRLVPVDDKPLYPQDEAEEQHRFQEAIAQRHKESPNEREERIGQYQKEIDRDPVLTGESPNPLGITLSERRCWVKLRIQSMRPMAIFSSTTLWCS